MRAAAGRFCAYLPVALALLLARFLLLLLNFVLFGSFGFFGLVFVHTLFLLANASGGFLSCSSLSLIALLLASRLPMGCHRGTVNLPKPRLTVTKGCKTADKNHNPNAASSPGTAVNLPLAPEVSGEIVSTVCRKTRGKLSFRHDYFAGQ